MEEFRARYGNMLTRDAHVTFAIPEPYDTNSRAINLLGPSKQMDIAPAYQGSDVGR